MASARRSSRASVTPCVLSVSAMVLDGFPALVVGRGQRAGRETLDALERALRPLHRARVVATAKRQLSHFLMELGLFDMKRAFVDERETGFEAAPRFVACTCLPMQCGELAQDARLGEAIAAARVAVAGRGEVLHRCCALPDRRQHIAQPLLHRESLCDAAVGRVQRLQCELVVADRVGVGVDRPRPNRRPVRGSERPWPCRCSSESDVPALPARQDAAARQLHVRSSTSPMRVCNSVRRRASRFSYATSWKRPWRKR